MKEKMQLVKELLESFKVNREIHEPFVMSFEKETDCALEWVIEQAERVQELEDKLARIRFVNNDYDKQNKRYREALEFYAKRKHYTVSGYPNVKVIASDYGEVARKALEGEE